MIVEGVLLAIDQSQDPNPIPLDVVSFDESKEYPVTIDFKGDPVGTAHLYYDDDRGLMARVTLAGATDRHYLAAGGVYTLSKDRKTITDVRIDHVALTEGNSNPEHPPFDIVM